MYTIGEFSRLCHVSSRMLRHYDALGVLRPAHTGAGNGYRYYDPAQLSTLARIESLKSYGFALAEIPVLLSLSPEALTQRIHARRLEAYGELTALRKALRRMEDDIIKMEGTKMSIEKYHVVAMETPAQRVFCLRKKICISEVHELFLQLYREMTARGLRRNGAAQMVYLGDEFNYESMDVEAQIQVAGEHADVREIPAQLCAAVTHTGPYDQINQAYDAVCAWLAQHPEYQVCGPGVERYLRDEYEVSDPEELETGVLFPVKSCK